MGCVTQHIWRALGWSKPTYKRPNSTKPHAFATINGQCRIVICLGNCYKNLLGRSTDMVTHKYNQKETLISRTKRAILFHSCFFYCSRKSFVLLFTSHCPWKFILSVTHSLCYECHFLEMQNQFLIPPGFNSSPNTHPQIPLK